MRAILLFILVLLGFNLCGQITIGSADMPATGDVLLRETSTVSNFDPNDTGANHVWDYSTLTPNTYEGDTAVDVISTPFAYQFFFNNPFLFPNHNADFALSGAGFNVQVLNVQDVFEYFKNSSTGFENVGFGANINGLPSSIQRTPVDEIYRFPLNYLDTSSSFSSYTIDVPTVLYYKSDQLRSNEVDGWGTLILPDGQSHDVLRIASTIASDDSIFLSVAGFGFNLPPTQTIEYKWLANGEPEPLLVIRTLAGNVISASYKVDQFTSVPEQVSADFNVYPNPSKGLIYISNPNTDAREYRLFDMQGRLLDRKTARGSFSWDLSDFPAGGYVLDSNAQRERLLLGGER